MINSFPKKIPYLTKKQLKIKDEFMLYWLNNLRKNYGIIENFNHNFVVNNSDKNFLTTLEIGSGIGEHLKYEKLTKNQKKNYFAMDSRTNVLKQLKKEHPNVKTVLGDCQKKIKFKSNYFDRIIAIHVLEHLPNLPATIKEVYRLLKNKGEFLIVIPCEGSLAYSLARKISAERLFKKKYNMSYDWFIKTEHINLPKEIISVIEEKFTIKKTSFFPMYLPLLFCNLCIGMIFKKK